MRTFVLFGYQTAPNKKIEKKIKSKKNYTKQKKIRNYCIPEVNLFSNIIYVFFFFFFLEFGQLCAAKHLKSPKRIKSLRTRKLFSTNTTQLIISLKQLKQIKWEQVSSLSSVHYTNFSLLRLLCTG